MADRPYHHGDLRAVLLANAERALAERGQAALSLREIAREAGVSHAAPGRHFRDKQALLDALALSGFERLTERLEAAEPEAGDARTRVLALARAYVGFAGEHAALLDLMYARKHDPDVSEQLYAAVGRLLERVMRPILDAQAAGEIAGGTPEAVTMTVSAAMHGLVALTATSSPEEIDAKLADMVGVLFEGLGPR
ncbi:MULTISPECIES: TetR/AcrR family transcriptional regulator [Nocardiopsis]|uniref:Transcriptional regulator, TetR family n=1 Tax=Nocardiopsis dassonvillei (strain ATCC 23218 / DSM 43111 / CIP 107115 / JCM 7437 / KCTC 9190 / NBRC 14626 / NCTC 10488 / NRRL B-5397 / IMRU 509) TaxID=446468 RepID=D7AVX9_NOCDD|nr:MULTISPECIES: TetR/AcrR family transcriptional regulator [Nocardiopsis]ADH69639.1 transcriptional regulator, TetR family [Nocardiopsis dassonvillei subsp. dassonvillei DSM 43111]APC37633.1 TetR family transcriptional regulator [Nocardiopsis dassonvillei]MCP3014641.1 TetR/AcrR family transcriptional regulator [Nocardiopsis dassonvillei]NKY78170.1 TetR/AcrR family transcriptional regulator [Nocardiopsis dassonvillei]VEI90152.1 DNA-binding transcriptional repressor FabR [Nocardiopsis dassonvil